MTVDYDGRPVADKRLFDAQARCAKLDDFGKRFANHHDGCPASFSNSVCVCGYDDALAALKGDG